MSGGDSEKQLLHRVLGGDKRLVCALISDLDGLEVADIHADMRCFIDHSHRLPEPGTKGSGSN